MVDLVLSQETGAATRIIQQRYAVAIADTLEIAVGLAQRTTRLGAMAFAGLLEIDVGPILVSRRYQVGCGLQRIIAPCREAELSRILMYTFITPLQAC